MLFRSYTVYLLRTAGCRRVPLLLVFLVIFLRFCARSESTAAHAAANVILWSVPPRSPDLNPIEKFWAWLRNRLRQRDLEDLRAGRPALGKTAFKARARAVCRSQHAQHVAAACALGLRKVCLEVVAKKGAMARS